MAPEPLIQFTIYRLAPMIRPQYHLLIKFPPHNTWGQPASAYLIEGRVLEHEHEDPRAGEQHRDLAVERPPTGSLTRRAFWVLFCSALGGGLVH